MGIGYCVETVSVRTPALLFGLVAALPAVAAEYCVTCANPAAMYACVVEGAAPDAPPDAREQLLCISALAKSADHESCSVPRSAPKPCPGILKIVALPEAGLPALPSPAAGSAPPSPGADDATPAAGPAAPRTVEELAEETVRSSKQGLEDAGNAVKGTAKKAGESVGEAGSAVGKAAKKTWDCMISLFSDC